MYLSNSLLKLSQLLATTHFLAHLVPVSPPPLLAVWPFQFLSLQCTVHGECWVVLRVWVPTVVESFLNHMLSTPPPLLICVALSVCHSVFFPFVYFAYFLPCPYFPSLQDMVTKYQKRRNKL